MSLEIVDSAKSNQCVMSLRLVESSHRPQDDAVGSIFGAALQLWDPMSLTPPQSPEEGSDVGIDDLVLCEASTRLPVMESVVQLFMVEEEELFACVYVYFSKGTQTATVSTGHLGPRLNRMPVVPHVVHADMVVAGPVLSSNGEEGTVFSLIDEDGKVAEFEVYAETIVVVHSSHSAMAVRARQLPESTRLVFGRHHHCQLREMLADVHSDDDLMYIPTTEILIGKGMDRLPLRGNDEERVLWSATKAFFKGMNETVMLGVERQNKLEFTRTAVQKDELPSVCLAALFS